MVNFGYGKVLDVDLATSKIAKTDVDPEFAEQYVGGMGFNCKILYDQVGADVGPFSPDNILIFANGPLTGTQAPCSGRTEVTTKSPMTGSIGTGNTGGIWGSALKHAGFDMVIVRNKSEEPVYLLIDDDAVEIKKAGHIWGKNTVVSSDIIREESGKGFSVLTIGQAGENLVRFACPVNDYHHVAARCGAGAVMGDKKLKAIAVRGTGTVKIARPEEFQKAVKETQERLMTARKVSLFGGGGESTPWDVYHGSMPGKNYQTGYFPHWNETHGRQASAEYMTREVSPCWACPLSCFRIAEVKEGKYAGLKVSRPTATGVQYAFGGKCAIDNMQGIWKCKELCQLYGMDYVSAAGCISFVMELYQRGIITTADTGGLEFGWGNEDASVEMLNKIAFREGLGDLLAEGSVRAAQKIGRGTEKYVMTIKGMEMMSPDPRACKRGYAFGLITNPRGGDNIKTAHFLADEYNPNWWVDQFDMFEDVKRAIYCVSPQEVSYCWQGKAMMIKWFEDLYSALNAVGVCFFPAGFILSLGPTHLSRLLSACIGRDISPHDLMHLGGKIFTIFKAHNMRRGLTRKDDNWPDRFYEEPLPDGPAKGAQLSRDTIERLLDEYYELRGWDRATGNPTPVKLAGLGLDDIARDLFGRVPPF